MALRDAKIPPELWVALFAGAFLIFGAEVGWF